MAREMQNASNAALPLCFAECRAGHASERDENQWPAPLFISIAETLFALFIRAHRCLLGSAFSGSYFTLESSLVPPCGALLPFISSSHQKKRAKEREAATGNKAEMMMKEQQRRSGPASLSASSSSRSLGSTAARALLLLPLGLAFFALILQVRKRKDEMECGEGEGNAREKSEACIESKKEKQTMVENGEKKTQPPLLLLLPLLRQQKKTVSVDLALALSGPQRVDRTRRRGGASVSCRFFFLLSHSPSTTVNTLSHAPAAFSPNPPPKKKQPPRFHLLRQGFSSG